MGVFQEKGKNYCPGWRFYIYLMLSSVILIVKAIELKLQKNYMLTIDIRVYNEGIRQNVYKQGRC